MRAVEAGSSVVGYDTDEDRIKRLAAGGSYVEDITNEALAAALRSGRYRPSSRPGDCEDFDVAVVTVPTPLREGNPDLSFIEAATASLAPHLCTGPTVVLESTTHPGTTEKLFGSILERRARAWWSAATSHSATARSASTRGTHVGPGQHPQGRLRVDQAWLAAVQGF